MADELLQMFQSITTHDHDELVDQFAYLLQLDPATATFFLESSNWNVETAVNNFLTTVEAHAGGGSFSDDDHDHCTQTHDDMDMGSEDPGHAEPQFDAKFVSDLSDSQNTLFSPDQSIHMQWSFVNPGRDPWLVDTSLVFIQGESFSGPQQIPVHADAGQRIDIQVSLRMPQAAGSYAGSWRLHNARGFFGDPVWVILNVGQPKHEMFQSAGDAAKMPFQGVAAAEGNHQVYVPVTGSTSAGGNNNNEIEDMDL